MISTLPVNHEYIASKIVIVSNNQLASGRTPNIPNVNQKAGIIIGASNSPSLSLYCLSSTPLARMIRLVVAIIINDSLLSSRIVISAGLYEIISIRDNISPTIAPSETNLSPYIPSPNRINEIGATHNIKFNLCFRALLNTRIYIVRNSKPPLVSNRPSTKSPNRVVISALRFSESSLRPFLASSIEIPNGPASNIKSNRIVDSKTFPISCLATLRLYAIGAATAINVRVAIIRPVDEAFFSSSTSMTIMPIGMISSNVHRILSAKLAAPTAVNETVNRIIGPIKLILPS